MRWRPILASVLILLPLTAVPPGARAASPGAAAVDRLLAAVGGRTALAEAGSVLREGVAVEPDGTGRPHAVLARGTAAEIRPAGGGGERWTVDRGLGYRVDADGRFEPITDVSLGLLVLQGTSASLPWILLANREVIEGADGGASLALRLTPTLTLRVAIDPATGLPASLTLVGPEGGGGTMVARLSDYRRAGVLLVPFLEEYLLDGHPAGTFRADRAIVHPAADGQPKGTP